MKLPFSGRRYYLKFGLERDPFPSKYTDQKVFLTHDMIHCLDQIKVSVENSSQLVVVASPPGSGKSVLSRYLGFIKSANWFVGHINGSRDMDKETLAFEIIRQHFPERKFVRSQAVYLLREFLQLFARNGRTPVVIIDDAHKLPIETLKFVLEVANFRQQDAQYRFVMFGNLAMDEKLRDPNLRELKPERYHHFRIPSLSLEQTRKYLEYRLSQCGECREDPFTVEAVQEIYRESAGLPGDTHAPAKRVMQEYHVAGSQQKILIQTAVTASICLLVFTGVYSAMNDDYNKKSENVAKSREFVVEVIPLSLPGTGTLIKPAGNHQPVQIKKEAPEPVKLAVKEEKPEAEQPKSESFIARLFRKKAKENVSIVEPAKQPDKKTGQHTEVVASLDSQLSLRLSDIIEQ